MKTMLNKQRGVSLEGTLVVIVLLIFVGVAAMKLVPSYMENGTIQKIFDTIVHDPEMQGAPVKAIRDSFAKRAMTNSIKTVTENDIEVSKDSGGLSLSVSYSVKIPLVSNASLLLEFNTSSSK